MTPMLRRRHVGGSPQGTLTGDHWAAPTAPKQWQPIMADARLRTGSCTRQHAGPSPAASVPHSQRDHALKPPSYGECVRPVLAGSVQFPHTVDSEEASARPPNLATTDSPERLRRSAEFGQVSSSLAGIGLMLPDVAHVPSISWPKSVVLRLNRSCSTR